MVPFIFLPKNGVSGVNSGDSPCTWGKRKESNVKDSDNTSDVHKQISPIPRAENTDIKKSLFARMGQRDSFFDGLVFGVAFYTRGAETEV